LVEEEDGYRVMVFNTTFNNILLYFNNIAAISWQSVYWWRKPEYLEKTTNLSQVTDKTLSNNVSSTPRHERGSNSQL